MKVVREVHKGRRKNVCVALIATSSITGRRRSILSPSTSRSIGCFLSFDLPHPHHTLFSSNLQKYIQ